jgi:MerR family transcriptional regulator, light-induced transcriptional regulator
MISQEIYDKYKIALLSGDRKLCTQIVNELIENKTEIKIIYEDLFQKSMYDVGTLWERNKISVAVEHLCTATTETLMNLIYPHLFSSEKLNKKALVTCTPGEFHQIGAKMVADFFELHSWNSYFLGANTPSKDFLNYVAEIKPDLIVISASISFNLGNLEKLILEIINRFPNQKIIIGGQAFRWGGELQFDKFDNVQIIKSLSELTDKYLIK